jgi:hypothetical protein
LPNKGGRNHPQTAEPPPFGQGGGRPETTPKGFGGG